MTYEKATELVQKAKEAGLEDSTYRKILEVWNYILDYASDPANDGQTPVCRQIVEALGISSTSVLARYMDELKLQGLIRSKGTNKHYSIAGAQLIVPMREFKKPKRRRRKQRPYYPHEERV